MPSQRIKWKPNTSPNVIAYEILKSDDGKDGAYTAVTQVLHMIPGNNWDNTNQHFYYDDNYVPYRYYRIVTLDRFSNRAEGDNSNAFKAGNDPVETPVLHSFAVNENTGGLNNLQYMSQGGTPIKDARIRVYKKIDWDTGKLANAIGTTITLATGGWKSPIFVQPGDTYTVVFDKTYEFGPDTTEITV